MKEIKVPREWLEQSKKLQEAIESKTQDREIHLKVAVDYAIGYMRSSEHLLK